ncbi:hypothetical protein [Mesorhizobium sp. M0046]|uniref:hypothetical protein n=1 Tax=Mesorhizobium sp. M0046 TaxID=2956858 RepID=UPI00333C7259
MRIVQNEVLDMDKFPFEPKRGRRIVEVKALDKPVAHRRAGETLVETRHSVFRRDQRAGDLAPWDRSWDFTVRYVHRALAPSVDKHHVFERPLRA